MRTTSNAAKAIGKPSDDDILLARLEGVGFQPVFIIGPQRSGTTALYRVLARTGLFNVTTLFHILNRHRLLKVHFEGQEEQARQETMQLFARKKMLGKVYNFRRDGPRSSGRILLRL